MKLTINRKELLKALSRVQGIAGKSQTMPVLSNILLVADDQGVEITATDIEIGIRGKYAADVEKPGAVLVSAKKLYDIVRELPEENVKIQVGESNWVSISSGGAKFKLLGLSKDEYVQFPEITSDNMISLSAELLSDMVKKTLFAAAENDARYVLNGLLIHMQPKGQGLSIRIVGTDGHRLAMVQRSLPAKGTNSKFVVPKASMVELKKLLGEVETGTEIQIAATNSHFLYKQIGMTMFSKLIDAQYPNYEQVIPNNNHKKVIASKDPLAQALKRVSILAKEKTNAVKIQFGSSMMQLATNNPDVGEAKENVAVNYAGADIEIGFNVQYMLDSITGISDTNVILSLCDNVSPCVVTADGDPGYTCVVMPMRV